MISFDGRNAEDNFDLTSIFWQFKRRSKTWRTVDGVRKIMVYRRQAQVKRPKISRWVLQPKVSLIDNLYQITKIIERLMKFKFLCGDFWSNLALLP